VTEAVERTSRWAKRCLEAGAPGQTIFGIVQGGVFEDLRRRSVQEIATLDFPGYAIGALAAGEDRETTWQITRQVTEARPPDRPRYLMGMGTPVDLVEGVARGVDMFDCVIGTRNGRSGTLFTTEGTLNMKNARFRTDGALLDPHGASRVGRQYTRAYLHHLFKSGELLGAVLGSLHNTWYLVDLVRQLRQSIVDGTFPACASSS